MADPVGTNGAVLPIATSSILGGVKPDGTTITNAAGAISVTNPLPTGLTYTATTWTPTFIGSSTAGTGQTYSTQVGSYEQIGRQVTVRFYVVATSLGTAAGNILIGGLPVASSSTANDYGSGFISSYTLTGLASLDYGLTGLITPGQSVISIYQNGAASTSQLTIAQAGGTAVISGVCSYHT